MPDLPFLARFIEATGSDYAIAPRYFGWLRCCAWRSRGSEKMGLNQLSRHRLVRRNVGLARVNPVSPPRLIFRAVENGFNQSSTPDVKRNTGVLSYIGARRVKWCLFVEEVLPC